MQIETISIRALGEYVILEVEIDGQTKELCRERLDAAFSHAVNVANFKPAQQPEPSEVCENCGADLQFKPATPPASEPSRDAVIAAAD